MVDCYRAPLFYIRPHSNEAIWFPPSKQSQSWSFHCNCYEFIHLVPAPYPHLHPTPLFCTGAPVAPFFCVCCCVLKFQFYQRRNENGCNPVSPYACSPCLHFIFYCATFFSSSPSSFRCSRFRYRGRRRCGEKVKEKKSRVRFLFFILC